MLVCCVLLYYLILPSSSLLYRLDYAVLYDVLLCHSDDGNFHDITYRMSIGRALQPLKDLLSPKWEPGSESEQQRLGCVT